MIEAQTCSTELKLRAFGAVYHKKFFTHIEHLRSGQVLQGRRGATTP